MEIEGVRGLSQGLIPLVAIAGLIAAVVAWRRRQGLEVGAEGIGAVRRLYFYFGTFAYMIVAGVGVVLVARYVLDELFGPPVLERDVTGLAIGVALALIWAPVWAWHRLRVSRLLAEEPAERESVLRKIAVYLTLTATAGLAAQGCVETLRWLFGARSFGGYGVAALALWSVLWAMTWAIEEREGQPTEDTRTVRRFYLYATSVYSLAMLAAGVSFVLYIIFREAYEGMVSLPVLLRGDETLWGDTMRDALAMTLVGGGIWAGHWLVFARADRSDTRQFYLYTLAIMGGAVATLSASGVLLYGLLQWGFGTPEQNTASAHFRLVPGALAPLLVGLLLWAYHWTTVEQERAAAGELRAARRIYGYIMAALGLGALAGMVIALVPTVIGIAITSAQEVLIGPDWWRDRMVLVATLGLLGVPVWGYFWYAVQRQAARFGAEERNSLPRRILVYGVLTAGTLTVLGSVSYLLFAVLNAMLENNLSLTLLRDMKWSIGTLAAALIFTPYYWFVLQEDRRAAPPVAERVAARKAVTLLIGGDGRALAGRLEEALGAKVRVLQRADADAGQPELSAEDLRRLGQRITEAAGGQVLVVVERAGIQVYSYR